MGIAPAGRRVKKIIRPKEFVSQSVLPKPSHRCGAQTAEPIATKLSGVTDRSGGQISVPVTTPTVARGACSVLETETLHDSFSQGQDRKSTRLNSVTKLSGVTDRSGGQTSVPVPTPRVARGACRELETETLHDSFSQGHSPTGPRPMHHSRLTRWPLW